ncbi:MAG: DUF4157 domain-containing protein [Caldilineaceae bacterium]
MIHPVMPSSVEGSKHSDPHCLSSQPSGDSRQRGDLRLAPGRLQRQIAAARGQGRRLDPEVRAGLESSFDSDLAAVRIHSGPAAACLAHALGAAAFTCGADIFFGAGQYRPHTQGGLRLLAHEITHVVQQAQGAVRPAEGTGLFISAPGDRWEVEAERTADLLLAGLPADLIRGGAAGCTSTSVEDGSLLIIQCHDSFEHRALGDVPTGDLYTIAANGPGRDDILKREIDLLWQWHQNPESVTEAQIKALCPWINTVNLDNGLLVTYGELNALPDYIATAVVADTISKDMLLPILQFIRQEGYLELSKLLYPGWDAAMQAANNGFPVAGALASPIQKALIGFQYAVYTPADMPGLSLVDKILGTRALDDLTTGLGIKGVDHYGALLARNACHFAPYSWYRWQASYLIARDKAKRAFAADNSADKARLTHDAWVHHGYADHFLQDSFAAGHLVNKTLIMQWFIEWAATQSTETVADWDFIQYVTSTRQADLSGPQLYNTSYNGPSNDPQTSEDMATYLQRLRGTGICADQDITLDAAYQNYLTFLSSAVTQSSSAAIHDYYNEHSLWVASQMHPTPYEVYGDATLLSGSGGADGAQFTSATAQLSQQTIRDLLATGQSATSAQQIRDYFPTSVRADSGEMLSLEQWNDTQKDFCAANIFPGLHDIVLRVLNPRIANLSRDQDLAPRWSRSLPDAGFTITTMLNYGSRVFAASASYVYELDPNSGKVLNQLLVAAFDNAGYETRLATDGQTLFVGVHGYAYGIALNDWSRTAWATSLPGARNTTVDVLCFGNRLLVGANGHVYELNRGNGQVMQDKYLLGWISDPGGDYTIKLATNGQTLFVGMHGYMYGVNLGRWSDDAWETSLPDCGYHQVDVLFANNRLFGGSNGYVYELNPRNGHVAHNLLVTARIGVGDYTTRLAASEQMLFAGIHGYVYGIDLDNWSREAWHADLTDNRYQNANVMYRNNQLLAGSYGYIYRIDPANGKVVRRVLLASVIGVGDYETRIVADGAGETLYAGAHGYVYAVNLCDEHGSTPAPVTTAGFGNLMDGQHLVWNADFLGVGRAQILVYNAGDNSWRLGDMVDGELQWNLVSQPGFASLVGGQVQTWVGDFLGIGHAQIVFYHAGDGNWWLGNMVNGALEWSLVSRSAGFGNLLDGQHPIWIADFSGAGHMQVMFYYAGDGNWWLGNMVGGQLQWASVSQSAGFGNLLDGQHLIWTADFSGVGHTQVMFYYAGDGTWWLGDLNDAQLQWNAVSRPGFASLVGSNVKTWTADFTGVGHSQIMFYYAGDGNWWLGDMAGGQLQWTLASRSAGFGNLLDGQHPIWIADFGGVGHTQVMFYYAGDGNWWLGDMAGGQLQWTLASRSAGFGNLLDGQHPIWIADFGGVGHTQVMFYNAGDGNWWLGDMAGGQLQWTLVSRSAGFGNLLDGLHPLWIANFSGVGHAQVMFYYIGDGTWWLSDMAGGQMEWSPVHRV